MILVDSKMESHWAQCSTSIQQPQSLSAFLAAFSFDSHGAGCQQKRSVLFTLASAKPPLPHPVLAQSVPWSQAQISPLSQVHFTFEVQAVTPAGEGVL